MPDLEEIEAGRSQLPVTADPRIPLALERTFLAWIRTALAMMGFGFVVARFGIFLRELEVAKGVAVAPHRGVSLFMGTSLVALGVLVAAYAAYRFHDGMASIERQESPAERVAAVPTVVAVALAAIGVATIWYFLAM